MVEAEEAAAYAAWLCAEPAQEAKLAQRWKAKQDELAQLRQILAAGKPGSGGYLLLLHARGRVFSVCT